jgi:hypothetical protein
MGIKIMKSMVEMREIGSGQGCSPILTQRQTGSAPKGGRPAAHSGCRAGIVSTFQQFPVKLAPHHAKLLPSEGAREGTNDGRFRYFPVLSGDEKFLGNSQVARRRGVGCDLEQLHGRTIRKSAMQQVGNLWSGILTKCSGQAVAGGDFFIALCGFVWKMTGNFNISENRP